MGSERPRKVSWQQMRKSSILAEEWSAWVEERMAAALTEDREWVDETGSVRPLQDHPNFEPCLRLYRRRLIAGPDLAPEWLASFAAFLHAVTDEVGMRPTASAELVSNAEPPSTEAMKWTEAGAGD